jgi:hypothetical protein
MPLDALRDAEKLPLEGWSVRPRPWTFGRASRVSLEERTMHTKDMISAHPDVRGSVNGALLAAIDECYACAQTCTSCADACVAEQMVAELRHCIRLNLDCADVCAATAAICNRRTGSNEQVIRRMLEACVTACRLCAEECERHAGMHAHCRICAESCRACERACHGAVNTM